MVIGQQFAIQTPAKWSAQVSEIQKTQMTSTSRDFSGSVLTRVFIVNQTGFSNYPSGIYTRMEITQLGTGSNRVGFTISREALNYRESAELAEGSECNQLTYKLSK